MGAVVFSWKELGLDKTKNVVTKEKFADLYSRMGYINFGSKANYHANARLFAEKVFKKLGVDSIMLMFLTGGEKHFVYYKDENGIGFTEIYPYDDYMKNAFQKVDWGNGYENLGLIEEVEDGKWQIIED